ncbi:conserved hypothetical protein [Histoplasma capsulatum H143]|uniref:BTB domain-containing protein n=1 Tax=Ajellomyces capsulatus (strain H143) TaxID=544712 RepID=C6HTI7_AJECH|nr:conserved hypothetical protein [Histoplasma capsulatum H143]
MADYKSIIRSPHFNFLVGKDRSCLTIHAGVVQNISEPISALINNGRMVESNSRVAVLEDVDENTFIGFCEYVYTGTYVTPDMAGAPDQSFNVSRDAAPDLDGLNMKNGEDAIESVGNSVAASDSTPAWSSTWENKARKKKGKKITLWDEELEDKPESPSIIDNIYPYERLWKSFRALDFMDQSASISSNPDLLFHAKLYVFATRYLIGSLRTQCLKSLHRDLCNFSLNRETAQQILDLQDFIYEKTGRNEPCGGSLLRNLVIHYVACKARTLAADERLCLLLDSNGEMGSNLFAKLVR